MIVGLCQITLHLPENRSLKGKRQVVRKICDRVRHRFHISIAEVDHLDLHQSCVLGLAVISNQMSFMQSQLSKIVNFIEHMHVAPILDQKTEILQFQGQTEGLNTSNQSLKGWDFMEEWDDTK